MRCSGPRCNERTRGGSGELTASRPGAVGIRMPPAGFAFECLLDVPEMHGCLFTENCHIVTPRAARGARGARLHSWGTPPRPPNNKRK
jgi:hypothetical protein